jgi:cytoskeletal protein CcmA (bactofilin family)
MFHRPKTDDQTTETKAVQKEEPSKKEGMSNGVFARKQSFETASETNSQISNSQISNPSNLYADTQKDTDTMSQDQKIMDKETNDAPSGVFQRAPQSVGQSMQRSVPNKNFSPGFTGTAKTPTYDIAQNEERKLVIGQGITMSGEIESCDYLMVEGTLEAALKGARMVEISKTGTFYGAVEIQEAVISGRFEGDMTVHGRLTIETGGSVTGTVSYKELVVEAGAYIDGKISPMTAAAANTQKKNMTAKNDNAGSDLPFDGAVAAE